MTNLNDKFSELHELLVIQNVSVLSAMSDIKASLDSIAVALGAPPATATATLADVIAAIAAQTLVLEDVHTDTQSIDQKALAIRDELEDVHLDTQSIDQKALVMRDKLAETYETLLEMLGAILLMRPDVNDIQRAIGLVQGDGTTTALARLGVIQTAVNNVATSTGTVAAPADNTQLWLLRAIRQLARDNAVNDGPDILDPATCASPFESDGMWLGPFASGGNVNVIIATWDAPLPTGVSFGTVFGIGTDYSELYNETWDNWSMYVSSTERQFARSPLDLNRYPTNEWLSFPAGAGAYAWSVAERGNIKVYLCGENLPTEVCTQYTITNASATQDYNIPAGVTTVTIISVTGGGAIGAYGGPGVVPGSRDINGVGSSGTFTGPGFIALLNGAGGAAIVVEICSPYPGPSPR